MKLGLRILLLSLMLAATAASVLAQSSGRAAQTVESLRAQLADVQMREEQLQARMRQLDEDLRPENIERYFALNGSTRPEEQREQRRPEQARGEVSAQEHAPTPRAPRTHQTARLTTRTNPAQFGPPPANGRKGRARPSNVSNPAGGSLCRLRESRT
jgi:TolA-binding protein